MSRPLFVLLLVLLTWGGTACESVPEPSAEQTVAPDTTVTMPVDGDVRAVYVPVYSRIYTRDSTRAVELAATLSVRNTDLAAPIQIESVRYYDSDGALLREHLARPVTLGPLGSREFVVGERDQAGGAGANFLVEWRGGDVNEPVVEAVMISTASTQGISFVSRGVPVRMRDEG